jgi:hypothetical protein
LGVGRIIYGAKCMKGNVLPSPKLRKMPRNPELITTIFFRKSVGIYPRDPRMRTSFLESIIIYYYF